MSTKWRKNSYRALHHNRKRSTSRSSLQTGSTEISTSEDVLGGRAYSEQYSRLKSKVSKEG